MGYRRKYQDEIACNPTRFKKGIIPKITDIPIDLSRIKIEGCEQSDNEPLGIMICSSDN